MRFIDDEGDEYDPFTDTKNAALRPLPKIGAASVVLLVCDRLYEVLGLTWGGWADQDILAGEALLILLIAVYLAWLTLCAVLDAAVAFVFMPLQRRRARR